MRAIFMANQIIVFKKASKKSRRAKTSRNVKVRFGTNCLRPVHGILKPSSGLVISKSRVVVPSPEIGMVEVDDVWINDNFQRNLMSNGIDDLIEEYEGLSFREAIEMYHEGCGLILAGRRKDGKISGIDGQRRLALAKYLKDLYGVDEFFIHAELVNSKSDKDESDMFNKRNHRKKLSPCEIFKGKLAAGDPVAIGVDQTLDGFGLGVKGVPKRKPTKRISCVVQLQNAYNVDKTGKNLKDTIWVLENAWGNSTDPKRSSKAYKTVTVGPVSIFLKKNSNVNLADLAKKLSRYSPAAFVGSVTPGHAYSGFTRYEAFADEIKRIYNSPLKRRPIV